MKPPLVAIVCGRSPRDRCEFGEVEYALAQRKRVLGVCRGAQLLAVMDGGKGITGHWDEERQYEPVHPVHAAPGSLAAQVSGSLERVNSIHHRAVADPGQMLRATAWSDDGVIEMVESPLLSFDARHLAPFSWVVGA